MINTNGKLLALLFSTFIVIILGVVLIQPIGTDVELAKVGSVTTTNESVTLTTVTSDIANETVTMTGATNISTGTLANNYLTTLTALRNESSEGLLGYCNITLNTGALVCNATNSTTAYADYTFNDYATGTLANDELSSFDACRNSTMDAILAGTHCNVTLTSGAVKGVYDNFSDSLAYIDYKYEPDTYVHSGTARTLITLVILFFAIAILAVGIGYAVKSFKEGGVM